MINSLFLASEIEIPLIKDLVLILGMSVLVVGVFLKLKLPTIVGFLITGIITGPNGLGLVKLSNEVQALAEIGVILLLFVIGLEFSLSSLWKIKKSVFLSGSIQVFSTILVVSGVAIAFGLALPTSIFIGFLCGLSSTAIVLKELQEKNAINSPHGKTALAILIYQDIVVVPLMLFTPMLKGSGDNIAVELGVLLLKGLVVIIGVLVSAKFIVPKLLYQVAKLRNQELFILVSLLLCFAIAEITASLGLSLALGAFMAGLIISESEYNHQTTVYILPFREVFTSIFFVSIGMLLNLNFLFEHIGQILLLVLSVFIIKTLLASLAALALKYPIRTSLLVGLSLFQVGEFAFVLSVIGLKEELIDQQIYQYFLAVSILTMAITPFVLRYDRKISAILLRSHLLRNRQRNLLSTNEPLDASSHQNLEDHLIIIGYGLNGKNLSLAAKQAGIPYVILELDADIVKQAKKEGEPIIFGDAVHEHLLNFVNLPSARVVVIAISDPRSTKQMVASIKHINPNVYLLVRTRFTNEVEELMKLGSNDVIPEEFETSVEIFSRVLHKYLVPEDKITDLVFTLRSENYGFLRHIENPSGKALLELPDLDLSCVTLQNKNLDLINQTLGSGVLKSKYKLNLVAVRRNNQFVDPITPEFVFNQNDVLYVFGKPRKITALVQNADLR